MRCDQRDHAVAEQAKPVHPGGQPISHSTNPGFKRGGEAGSAVEDLSPLGTGEWSGGKRSANRMTWSRSWKFRRGSSTRAYPDQLKSVAIGVAHCTTDAGRLSPPEPRLRFCDLRSVLPIEATGVGQYRAATLSGNWSRIPCAALATARSAQCCGSSPLPERSASVAQGVGHAPVDPEREEPRSNMRRADLRR